LTSFQIVNISDGTEQSLVPGPDSFMCVQSDGSDVILKYETTPTSTEHFSFASFQYRVTENIIQHFWK